MRSLLTVLKNYRKVIVTLFVATAFLGAIFALPVNNAKASTAGKVTADELNVRIGPGSEYDQLTHDGYLVYLVQGDVVEIEYKTGNWYFVSAMFKGAKIKGFVSGYYIQVTGSEKIEERSDFTLVSTPTPMPTSVAELPCMGIVNADCLHVREKGSLSGKILDKIYEGTEVVVVSKELMPDRYWYYVYYAAKDGTIKEGHCASEYITMKVGPNPKSSELAKKMVVATPTPSPSESTAAPNTRSNYNVNGKDILYKIDAKVIADSLNVRQKASASSAVVATLKEGDEIIIINTERTTDGVWFNVMFKSNGKYYDGFVSEKYVRVDYSTPIKGVILDDGTRLKRDLSTDKYETSQKTGNVVSLYKGTEVTIVTSYFYQGSALYHIVYVSPNTGEKYEGYAVDGNVGFATTYVPPTPTPTNTPLPTNTPKPTATPTPAAYSGVKPAYEVADLVMIDGFYAPNSYSASQAVKGQPIIDKVRGIGVLSGLLKGDQLFYTLPGEVSEFVVNENGIPVPVKQGEEFYLYDLYVNSSTNYRLIGVKFNNKMYYGYILEVSISALSGKQAGFYFGTEGKVVASNSDFATDMRNLGFPESYIGYLEKLHRNYPLWQFKPYNAVDAWDFVMEEEMVLGRSLIPISYDASYKSLAVGAFNYDTGKYVPFDGQTWVNASESAIAYYMDPRNWLNSEYIYMFEDLTYDSSIHTNDGVEEILKGTPYYKADIKYYDTKKNYKTYTKADGTPMKYSEAIIAAAEYTGVSPYHIATRMKQEVVISSTMVSNSVTGTVSGYEGYYNFFNIGAYHSTVEGGNIINGLKYAKSGSDDYYANVTAQLPWDNPYKAIVGGAYLIGQNYILKGQHTVYLQKFNVTGYQTYTHQYMSNIEAPMAEARKMASAYSNPANIPLTFSIPVFLGIPEKICEQPNEKNTDLSFFTALEYINVEDAYGGEISLTPSYDASYNGEYVGYCYSDSPAFKVDAQAVLGSTKLTGVGYYKLDVGTNYATIVATSADGQTKTYKLKIIRR